MIFLCLIKRKNSRLTGFSLVETAIILAVFGLVLAGMWGLVNSVRENSNEARTVSQMVQIVQNIRDYYKGFARTDMDDFTDKLILRNIITTEMIRKSAGPTYKAAHFWDKNSVGGSFIVRANATNRYNFFNIEFNSLSQKACAGLVSKLTGSGGPSGRVSAKVNAHLEEIKEIAPEMAIVMCDKATEDNTITLVYRLRQ